MSSGINKEQIESDRVSALPFALKMELWNIFSAERNNSDHHRYFLSAAHRVVEIRLEKFLKGFPTAEKRFYWENPIQINPPDEIWIEVRSNDILMRFPDE